MFQRNVVSGIELWTGNPSCQTAHDALVALVTKTGPFIDSTVKLGPRRQGNLGEFISFHVAHNAPLKYTTAFALNASSPLQDISLAGLDVTYLYLDENDTTKDLVYIQEVKTTGGLDLSYADQLTVDYRKLFGEDAALTLNTRMQSMATRLEYEHKRPDYADRVIALSETTAQRCVQVGLIPTLVHERKGTLPVPKLVAVKSAITALGWGQNQINPWSIAMDDLLDRLTRIARGHP